MSFKIATAALLTALAAAPATAMADSITLTVPATGASLHSESVDMNVYFTDAAGSAYEVVATYVSDSAPDQPQRLIMALEDGDDVSFALPAHPETLYNFQRKGGILTVTSTGGDAATS
ncbi:hypothetical protein [Paracoccus marinaquae]|uniref:Uncharacterized protein n=1 Tax=Paracoccus marinaquae TaxID=2841926 RepID=A0ABS6ALT7_9RHOB|nr:hypothetical protein [Paracoccus marinaquae]MBU3031544.1 hypothetical protein [Paracoccus marinaquae]